LYSIFKECFTLDDCKTCNFCFQIRPKWREKQNLENRQKFFAFKREIFARYNQDLSLEEEIANRAAEEKKKRERQTAVSQLATPQRRLRSGITPLNRQAENRERIEFPLKFGLLARL
jgi:hypothetical protein